MSRFAWLKILAGLVAGMILGIGVAVLVNLNSVLMPTPTQTPEYIYVSVYPTPEPTQDAPLPEQCATLGSAYQVVYTGQTIGSNYYEALSPDKRSKVFSDTQGVYLGRPDGTTQTMYAGQREYPLPFLAYWSPDSQYIAASWTGEPPLIILRADGTEKPTPLSDLIFPLNFVSWSPDNRAIAVQDNYLGDVSIWTIDGERTYKSGGRALLIDQPPVWSPDGKLLLFQWRDNTHQTEGGISPYGFTIAAVNGSSSSDGILTGAEEPNSPFRIIPVWSPDSQYVALTFLQYVGDHYAETVTIYTRTGKQIGEEMTSIDAQVYSELLLWSNDWHGIRWLGDVLFYTRPVAKTEFDVLTFDPKTQNLTTLYDDLPKPLFYADTETAFAVYKNDYSIDILHEPFPQLSPGGNIQPLVADATDAGDPDWSPGGEWVAAVWATGEKEARRVFLSWMHPDGGGRQDVDADFDDVRDLRWLKDNQALAYVAWRGGGADIEIADTKTGSRRTIAEGYQDIQRFTYDEPSDTLSFWWRMADGSAGKDAYRLDGTQVYRIAYPNDLILPRGEFWSPDHTVVAFKIAPDNYGVTGEQLWLAYTDGRPPMMVRDHLNGLGDPLWSPDSQMLAFTQSRRPRPASLQVVDTTGVGLWDYAPFPIPRPIAWVKCA